MKLLSKEPTQLGIKKFLSKIKLTKKTTDKEASEASSDFVSNPKKKSRKKKTIIIAACAVVVIGAVIGIKAISASKSPGGTTTTYTTATVTKRDISNTLSSSGTLAAAQSYSVTSLVSGEILSADFEKGDTVTKGQTLYQIDTTDAETSIASAKLSVERAQLSYNNVLKTQSNLSVAAPAAGTITALNVSVGDTVQSGSQIGAIKNSATMSLSVPFNSADADSLYVGQTATVTLDSTFETLNGTITKIAGSEQVLAGNMLVRYVTIDVSNPGGITDSTAATATVGEIACNSSSTFTYKSSQVITAKASGTVISILCDEGSNVSKGTTIIKLSSDDIASNIASAKFSLEDAENSLADKETALEDYTITSPIDGTIISKDYKEGDKLGSGSGSSSSTSLCTIYDLSYLTMDMSIDELDISSVAVGQSVTITADAVSGKTYTGTVTSISIKGTTSNGVTAYPVTVQITETDGLLPGMNVTAEIVVKSVTNVLSIPVDAVSRGNQVLVKKDSSASASSSGETLTVGSSGIPHGFEYVTVTIGLNDDDYIEVDSGLSEGDVVAVVTVNTDTGGTTATAGLGGLTGGAAGGSGGEMPSGGGGGAPSGGGAPMGG